MCRNIKTLFNFEPPATEEEVRASALQFVRKLSGFGRPSQANEAAFNRAVAEVSESARRLLVCCWWPQDRPPVLIPFFTFRVMVGCGMVMLLLAWLGTYLI